MTLPSPSPPAAAGASPGALGHLLLLADGRLPTGGHAHSAGVEAAVADGRVTGLASLEAFVEGRLATTGLVEAALAAATARRVAAAAPGLVEGVLAELDDEAGARVAPRPLREASRRLGRQLVRVGSRCWPSPVLASLVEVRPGGAHVPVAQGAVAVAAGLGPLDAAHLALHHAAATPAQAGVRLLGLDPFAVAALCARLAEAADALAREADEAARGPLRLLPARAGPLVEVAAVEHRAWELRHFAT